MKLDLLSSASVIALGGALAMFAPLLVDGHAHAAPTTQVTGSDVLNLQHVSVVGAGGVNDLLDATSITIGNASWNTGSGSHGDFTALSGGNQPLTGASLILASLGSYNFTSSSVGNFSAVPSLFVSPNTLTSEVVTTSGSLASGTESLTIYLVGNFSPSGSGQLSSYSGNNASETISFTETGITDSGATGNYGAVSGSATFATPAGLPPLSPPPPPVGTPEPASMMLLGAGLVGLGAVRRRRGRG